MLYQKNLRFFLTISKFGLLLHMFQTSRSNRLARLAYSLNTTAESNFFANINSFKSYLCKFFDTKKCLHQKLSIKISKPQFRPNPNLGVSWSKLPLNLFKYFPMHFSPVLMLFLNSLGQNY